MAGLIERKPLIGFAACAIFGALGMLLVGIDGEAGHSRTVVTWMFRTLGAFLFVAAAGSLVKGLSAFRREEGRRGRHDATDRQD